MGDSKSTLFWEDRWIDGFRICELAPTVYDKVPKRIRKVRLVSDALADQAWARDVGPNLAAATLEEFLRIWQRISQVQLTDGMDDKMRWA